jgi:hypothetical protein
VAFEVGKTSLVTALFMVHRPDFKFRFRLRTGLVVITGSVAAATSRY